MRVTLKRSGGFGGIRVAASIDAVKLSADKAAELRRLIDETNYFALPQSMRADRPKPDRFQYDLTIDDEGRSHTVSISEEAAPARLKSLISWILKNSKA